MGDIAAFLKNEWLSMNEIKLTPVELSELITSIKNGTISGKIGKEVKVWSFALPWYEHFIQYFYYGTSDVNETVDN